MATKASSSSAAKASQAINALILFSDKDQELLLNVIQDYFDPRSSNEDSSGFFFNVDNGISLFCCCKITGKPN